MKSIYVIIVWLTIYPFAAEVEESKEIDECEEYGICEEKKQIEKQIIYQLEEKKVEIKNTVKPSNQLDLQSLQKSTASMGDPIRVLSKIAGVQNQNDFNVRPFIRGGKSEETRVYVSGIPLLQPYHTGGVFSILNMESISKMDVATSGFPMNYEGSLSGAITLHPKYPSFENFNLSTNISMLRGNLLLEGPVVRDRVALQIGLQSFYFNNTLNGLLETLGKSSNDPTFEKDINGYQDHINFPTFNDVQGLMVANITKNLQVSYLGIYSQDKYDILVPQNKNIIKNITPDSTVVIFAEPPAMIPQKEIKRSKQLAVDSLSKVRIHNQNHILNVPWVNTDEFYFNSTFSFQSQSWFSAFKNEVKANSDLALSTYEENYRFQSQGNLDLNRHNSIGTGFSFSHTSQNFHTQMPFALYDVMVNSNLDMLSGLGYYSPSSYSLQRLDSSQSSFDHLSQLPLRLQFNHKGQLQMNSYMGFVNYSFYPTKDLKMNSGFQIHYDTPSYELVLNSNLFLEYYLGKKNTFFYNLGKYSQNNFDFYYRNKNPTLKSEKSIQTSLGWSFHPNSRLNITIEPYYKHYMDLIGTELVSLSTIEYNSLLVAAPQTNISPSDINFIRETIEPIKSVETLPDSLKSMAYEIFGNKEFQYHNQASGNALGTDISVNLNPNNYWNVLLAFNLTQSKRKNVSTDPFYDYRYNRPWGVYFENGIKVPKGFELNVSYQLSAGHPYTPYSGTLEDSAEVLPIEVGSRNSGILDNYSRVDIRLNKNTLLFKRKLQTFIEVWNSFNTPNYFARDFSTGELKSAELNWPFPFVFLGLRYEI